MHKSHWILITGVEKIKNCSHSPVWSNQKATNSELKGHISMSESMESKGSELLRKNPADSQHLWKIKLEKEREKNSKSISSAKKSEPMECCAACSWEENSSRKY